MSFLQSLESQFVTFRESRDEYPPMEKIRECSKDVVIAFHTSAVEGCSSEPIPGESHRFGHELGSVQVHVGLHDSADLAEWRADFGDGVDVSFGRC